MNWIHTLSLDKSAPVVEIIGLAVGFLVTSTTLATVISLANLATVTPFTTNHTADGEITEEQKCGAERRSGKRLEDVGAHLT